MEKNTMSYNGLTVNEFETAIGMPLNYNAANNRGALRIVNVEPKYDIQDLKGSGDVVNPLYVVIHDGEATVLRGNRRLCYLKSDNALRGNFLVEDLAGYSKRDAKARIEEIANDHGQELGLSRRDTFNMYCRCRKANLSSDGLFDYMQFALMAISGDWVTIRAAFVSKYSGDIDALEDKLVARFKSACKGTLATLAGLYELPDKVQESFLALWTCERAFVKGEMTVKTASEIGLDIGLIIANLGNAELKDDKASEARRELRVRAFKELKAWCADHPEASKFAIRDAAWQIITSVKTEMEATENEVEGVSKDDVKAIASFAKWLEGFDHPFALTLRQLATVKDEGLRIEFSEKYFTE